MTGMGQPKVWLTHEQIDEVVAGASADDIIEAMAAYPNAAEAPLKLTREIFNRAADRLGYSNGASASQMVKASDFKILTEKLSGLLSVDSPLEDATDLSPLSADIGE